MAKKKKKNENTLSYLQMPLPESGKYSKMTKVSFGGLNKRYTLDSGELSMENNISSKEYPYLVPSESRIAVFGTDISPYHTSDDKKIPIGMYAFDNFLIVVYYHKYYDSNDNANVETIKVDYITEDEVVYTGILKKATDDKPITDADLEPVSVVQFNVYDTPTDPLTGQYVKKLLFFPYKASMYMHIENITTDISGLEGDDLKEYSTDVMYCYENGDEKTYCAVGFAVDTVDDAGNKKYKRVVRNFSDEDNEYFLCENMEAEVKEYYNNTPEIDKSGGLIFPPPDTASHNCYYRNTYNHIHTNNGTDIYKWCEYETLKREDEWGLKEYDATTGKYEIYGFVKEGDNYIKDGTAYGWKVSAPPAVPDIKYATVHLSRVFGVDDDRVYASGYNNYANWNLDTTDEYNEANSWCSPAQSNTKAGGEFTGITNFQGHVVCFKRDFMHEIYNTKNPFRLVDIYAEGSIDNRSIQDVDGKLIFVSEDDVKIYTGSNPRIIGYNLNMPRYEYAVSGTDNRNYYLYCKVGSTRRHLYTYDTYTEMWSEQSIDNQVLSFAHNKNGMYMLCDNGVIYQMDTGSYNHEWSFETDLITNKTVNIKHIKKLQMLVEAKTNAKFKVYILYDDEVFNEDTSHLVCSSERVGKYPIRVKPRNTANYGFRLHFEGEKYVKLYELEIFIEAGGDLYV